MSLYSVECLLSAYSFCLSFARTFFSQRSCCQWASVILSFGIITLGSLSLSRLPFNSSAGGNPVTGCGVVVKEEVLQCCFSNPSLPTERFSLTSVWSHYSAKLCNCSAASMRGLSCVLFPDGLGILRAVQGKMVAHCHHLAIRADGVYFWHSKRLAVACDLCITQSQSQTDRGRISDKPIALTVLPFQTGSTFPQRYLLRLLGFFVFVYWIHGSRSLYTVIVRVSVVLKRTVVGD